MVMMAVEMELQIREGVREIKTAAVAGEAGGGISCFAAAESEMVSPVRFGRNRMHTEKGEQVVGSHSLDW